MLLSLRCLQKSYNKKKPPPQDVLHPIIKKWFIINDSTKDPTHHTHAQGYLGREGDGLGSNRPELAVLELPTRVSSPALRECVEDHKGNVNRLYLIDNESSLLGINKWVGGGSRLNLSKSPDADILKRDSDRFRKKVKHCLTNLTCGKTNGHSIGKVILLGSESGPTTGWRDA